MVENESVVGTRICRGALNSNCQPSPLRSYCKEKDHDQPVQPLSPGKAAGDRDGGGGDTDTTKEKSTVG